MIRSYQDLCQLRDGFGQASSQQQASVLVCAGTGCVASGSLEVYEALQRALDARGVHVSIDLLLEDKQAEGITTVKSGCHGFCEMGPLVRIEPAGILYTKVTTEDAESIAEAIADNTVVDRLLYKHPGTGEVYIQEEEIPFYKYQTRVALANCGHIDPDDIRAYIFHDGYEGAAKALAQRPEDIIETVLSANLRGRGGGGFPAGRKWSIAA